MKSKVNQKQKISKNCFVCGIENPISLKTKFYQTENNEVVALFTPHTYFQSYPGILHGGISATILDETMGRAIMLNYGQNSFGMTVELNLKYKKPVPLDVELKVKARITNDRGRLFEASGELILPDGQVAVEGHGKFMKRDITQISSREFLDNDWIESDAEEKESI